VAIYQSLYFAHISFIIETLQDILVDEESSLSAVKIWMLMFDEKTHTDPTLTLKARNVVGSLRRGREFRARALQNKVHAG